MTENNKWIKTAIIIVAVVVILESVVIISNRGSAVTTAPSTSNQTPTQVLGRSPEGAVSLAVKTDTTTVMKVKGSYKVWVEMTGQKSVNLDAIDLYVRYDKSAFTVSNLDFSGMTVKPTFSKISDLKSVVVVNYFLTETLGLTMTNGKIVNLVGFTVTPKKAGDYTFEVSLGDDTGTSKTMLVENQTSKEVAFDVQKLTVSVR